MSESAASAGSTTRIPEWTRRTDSASSVAGASLTTKPWAPDWMARRRNPGRPKVVTMRTLVAGSRSRSLAVALSPSVPGMSTSMRTTSGRCSSATGRTSSPFPTWATTSISVSRASSAASAPRTMAWSSASITRIIAQLRYSRFLRADDIGARRSSGCGRPGHSVASCVIREDRRRARTLRTVPLPLEGASMVRSAPLS